MLGYKKILAVVCLILLGIAIIVIINFWVKDEIASNWHWRGIIPGQTTVEEVIMTIGEPDNIVRCKRWGGELNNPYEYPSGYLIKPCLLAPLTYEYEQARASDKLPGIHQIHFRNGKVWLVVEHMRAYPDNNVMSIEAILDNYGEPETEAWPIHRRIRHLVYCEQGVIVATNDIQAERVFYFEPMPLLDCLGEFEFYLTLRRPSNIIIN